MDENTKNRLEEISKSVYNLDGTDDFAKSGIISLISRILCPEPRIDWGKIQAPPILHYSTLIAPQDPAEIKVLADQIAIVKLAGGTGKKMGCIVPKCLTAIVEENDVHNLTGEALNILDITVKQVKVLNERYGCNIPLLLMDSFKTIDVREVLKKYESQSVTIHCFTQLKCPQLDGYYMPLPSNSSAGKKGWCSSGHGDVFEALVRNGWLEYLLSEGKKYVFISNVNNLGGTVDWKIANHMINSDCEFSMEVTRRTAADINSGGSLISYEGKLQLLEYLQASSRGKKEEFSLLEKFEFHNTNNLWVDLRAIKRLFEKSPPNIDIIEKLKAGVKSFPNIAVCELKTYAGSAIKHFTNSMGICVPRSRFLPVRSTSDMMILQSGIYTLSEDCKFVRNCLRGDRPDPVIKLEGPLQQIAEYRGRFGCEGFMEKVHFQLPNIMDLENLTISGEVFIGLGVTFRGNVIVRSKGEVLPVPKDTILENEVLEN